MEQLVLFFLTILTALALENAVFARALGLHKSVLFLESPKMGMLYGGVFTFIATLTSFPVALVNYLLADVGVSLTRTVRAPLYLLCVFAVYLATYYAARRFTPDIFEKIAAAMPVSTFNTAMFAAFYISNSQSFKALQTVAYAFGSGIGYTLALLVIFFARKRLALCPTPRAFRGLPILLVYIGLLSLAIYGLVGHGLPV